MLYVRKDRLRLKIIERLEDGSYKTHSTPELEALNEDLLNGRITKERAAQMANLIRDKLRKPKQVSWLSENMELLGEFTNPAPGTYWKEVGLQRERRSNRAAYDRLRWALKQLGQASLLAASRAELKAKLDLLTPRAKKRAIGPINAILRHRGLNKLLEPPSLRNMVKEAPRYLSLPDFLLMVEKLPKEEWKLACKVAFGTGARYGELFTVSKETLHPSGAHIWIDAQRYKNWAIGPTKNGKTGHAFVIPELRQAVRQWVDLPEEVKREMRSKSQPSDQWQEVSGLNFHNLRHSYAKHLLVAGATLEDLRKWMRDNHKTIEDYYLAWVQDSAEMQATLRKFG